MVLIKGKELRERLNISTATERRMLKEGMPHVAVGSGDNPHNRYDFDEVMEWIKGRQGKEEDKGG